MIRRRGPFQVIESEGNGVVDSPIEAPRRRYACRNYSNCLNLAAALNWDSFTCRGCSGQIDEQLLWRAHLAQRKDDVANRLCRIPGIKLHEISPPTELSQDLKEADSEIMPHVKEG